MPTVKEIPTEEARRIQYDVRLYVLHVDGEWFPSVIGPKDRLRGTWEDVGRESEIHYWLYEADCGTRFGIALDHDKPEYTPDAEE